jgi:hypothetical protein
LIKRRKKKKRTSGLLADLGVENRSFAHVSGVWAMTARARETSATRRKTRLAEVAKIAPSRERTHTRTLCGSEQAQAHGGLGFSSNENHPQIVFIQAYNSSFQAYENNVCGQLSPFVLSKRKGIFF